MRMNKINHDEYHEQHFLISKNLDKEFKEAINRYNNYGLDKTTKSELLRLFTKQFVAKLTDPNDDVIYDLLKELKYFRDSGAGA